LEFSQIIKDSEKRLNKLKILNNFFNHSQIMAVFVRTKVINDVFSINKTLDTNKLELFHLQYTDSLLDLLLKLKKKLEQNYLLAMNEIQIKAETIKSIERDLKKDDFKERVLTHNLIIQSFIETVYQNLAFDDKKTIIGLEAINDFSQEMGIEFFRKIGSQEYQQLNNITSKSKYELFDFKFEKKLLGKLNVQKFRFKFLCGFQHDNQFIEIYEFINYNEYFVFLKEKKEFLPIDLKEFKNIDFSKNNPNKKEMLLQLNQQNIDLKNKAERNLKSIPADVETVLQNYCQKIESIEFLDDLQNIDEQTNILRTMLNINIK
jgi:hypothetical protein